MILVESRFNSLDGTAGTLSIRACTACIPARKLYDGPLHEIALELFDEVEYLINTIENHPDAWKGDQLSASVVSFLGDRPYISGAQTGNMLLKPAYVLQYTRHSHRMNCMVGSLLLALETVRVLQAGCLSRYLNNLAM